MDKPLKIVRPAIEAENKNENYNINITESSSDIIGQSSDILIGSTITSEFDIEQINEYDSDESLGILHLDIMEADSDLLADRYLDFNMTQPFPFLQIPEQDYSGNENVINKIANLTISLADNKIPLNKKTDHVFEKKDLDITKDYSFSADHEDLNSTFTHAKNTFTIKELSETKRKVEHLSSSYILKKFTDSQSVEISILQNIDSPKYCSTPTHEANYTFTLEDDILSSPVPFLNKTIVKEDFIKTNIICKDDELFVENYEHEFNKTYDNISGDTKHLALAHKYDAASLDTNTGISDILNATFELKANETYMKFSNDVEQDNDTQKAMLNLTTSHKELRINLQRQCIAPGVPGDDLISEDTSDELFELPESPQGKNLVNEVKTGELPTISKSVDDLFAVSDNKYSEIDKKKTRKSVIVPPQRKGIDAVNKETHRRKTLGSISSESDNISSNQKSLSRYAQRQCSGFYRSAEQNTSKKYPVKTAVSYVKRSSAKSIKNEENSKLNVKVSTDSSSVDGMYNNKLNKTFAKDKFKEIVTVDNKVLKAKTFNSKIPVFSQSANQSNIPKPSITTKRLVPVSNMTSLATSSSKQQKTFLGGESTNKVLTLRNETDSRRKPSQIFGKRQSSVEDSALDFPRKPSRILGKRQTSVKKVYTVEKKSKNEGYVKDLQSQEMDKKELSDIAQTDESMCSTPDRGLNDFDWTSTGAKPKKYPGSKFR